MKQDERGKESTPWAARWTAHAVTDGVLTVAATLLLVWITQEGQAGEGRQPTGKRWIDMNYGQFLSAALEVQKGNIVPKGLAIRLDGGEGGVTSGTEFILFDTDTLRCAAGWIGPEFIDWKNIAFDGSHQTHASIVGHKVFTNPLAPGWGHPNSGGFEDTRIRGRDGVAYGPLDRAWAHWKGLYLHGDRVVLSYTVGEVSVLESPDSEGFGDARALTRTINLGPRPHELILQVAHERDGKLKRVAFENNKSHNQELAVFAKEAEKRGERRIPANLLDLDGESTLEVSGSNDFNFKDKDFTIYARIRTEEGGTILAKAPRAGPWAPDGKTFFVRQGKLCYDIGWVGVVQSRRSVNDGEWHEVAATYDRVEGLVRLYVDGRMEGEGELKPESRAKNHAVRLAYTSPNFPEERSAFKGTMTEVRFYQRRLDAGEVAGLARLPIDDENLKAHWVVGHSSGALLRDRTGEGHHARLAKVRDAAQGGDFPLAFDGETSLEVAESEDFDFRDKDFSIYAHVRTTEGGTILSKSPAEDSWSSNSKSLFIRKGRLVYDIGFVGQAQSADAVGGGEWHELVMTYHHVDGAVRFYIDGRPSRAIRPAEEEEEPGEGEGEKPEDERGRGEPRLKPEGPVEGHVVRIGYTRPDFPEAAPSCFHGTMSEVRFYQRKLEPEEVANLAKSVPEADDSLVARWELLTFSDRIIEDLSGRGHIAKLRGIRSPPGLRTVTLVGLVGGAPGTNWVTTEDGHLRLRVPAGDDPVRLKLVYSQIETSADVEPVVKLIQQSSPAGELESLTRGGPARWRNTLTTKVSTLGRSDGPFVVDTITTPMKNPYRSWMRLGGFDFFEDGKGAAVCTWMGDVWIVEGLGGELDTFTWRRIAAGLYQPLGLKIVDGKVYVLGRDQITLLHDLNGDGESDFYENFNNDAQVTPHFHEFAMDLQTDSEGNFYYAKAGRHALDAVVPQHGTVLKVSRDGSTTEFIARGFRAPNGLCVNGDGTFIVSDQEGHWTPENRINWVTPGGFYGYMWGYHPGEKPTTYDEPLCWIDHDIDISPASQLWVPRGLWGPLGGHMLSLSYGMGEIQLVLHEKVDGQFQGGVTRLPIAIFPTGIMRGRFNTLDGQLYGCGLFGWSSRRTFPGGFYRIRYTGKPLTLPVELHATRTGMVVRFSAPLDESRAARTGSYRVTRWNYKWAERYGSDDFRVTDGKLGREAVKVQAVKVSRDGRSVFLEMPDIRPCMQMRIQYRLRTADKKRLSEDIYHTIHKLGDPEPYLESF